jgi:type I restriction enzyme S subunit
VTIHPGWKHTTFENHIDLISGFAFKSSNYSDKPQDIKLLRGDNIEPGALRWRDAKRWPREQCDELVRYKLEEGDFIIAMDRTWISSGLKVAEVKADDLPCLLVQRVSRIRAKESLEQGLLRQYFSSHKFEQYVKSVQTETAVPHISAKQIREFPVLLPPLPEQKKIAKILSTWDKAIATTEKLLTNSQQQKKALMQQLLTGNKRLLDENGERFSGDWEEGSLSDLALIKKGRALNSKDLKEGNYPVIAGGKVSPYTHSDFTHEDVITVSASGAYAGYVAYHPYKLWASDCSVVTNKPNSDIGFIYQLMSHLQAKIYSLQSGGAQPHVYPKDLEVIKVDMPQLEEQRSISKVLSSCDKITSTLKYKLISLKQEKKALMQQLLTGKRRVKVN